VGPENFVREKNPLLEDPTAKVPPVWKEEGCPCKDSPPQNFLDCHLRPPFDEAPKRGELMPVVKSQDTIPENSIKF